MTLNTSARRAALVSAILLAIGCAPAYAGHADLNGLNSDQTFDQFIVKYRDGSRERSDIALIDNGLTRAARAIPGSTRALGVKHFRHMSLDAEVIRSDRKLDRVDAETLMRQIASDPNVEYVEVDVRMYPTLTPNDSLYNQQPHYFNATTGINVPNAWDKSTGAGIVIAVIDTGSTPHSDLNANLVAGYDFITSATASRDGNGRDANPNDEGDWTSANDCFLGSPAQNSSWHGTHVAGTLGALTNNGVGVAGVAFGARIQHARALGRCGGTTSDIADAITWASGGTVSGVPANANVARVINMSLGGGGACSSTFQNAINGAVGRGTTVVVAAGNSNSNAANFQPASCANVVTVGAINNTNAGRASFSNYGAAVDLSAPGVNVLSTINGGVHTQGAEAYTFYSGTSMATPHVAGVVALAQSRRLASGLALYSPAQMEAQLKSKIRAFPVTPDQPIGTGILNADAVVTAAGPQPPVITSLSCWGTGGGFCIVYYTSDNPVTISWSGGYSSSTAGNGPTYSNVCGPLSGFSVGVTVTLSSSIGSTSATSYPFCQR